MSNYQDTSREAYYRMLPRLERSLAEVVSRLLEYGPCTAEEVRLAWGITNPNQVAPRFTALKDMGVIEDSGERRGTELGRAAIVWRLVGDGHAAKLDPAELWTGCAHSLTGVHIPVSKYVADRCRLCGATR